MKSEYSYHSFSSDETITIGESIAKLLKGDETVGITGDLGAGKTQLVKGICKYFGIAENEVSSPTFSIVNEYHGNKIIYHFDFYRILSEDELWDIGIEDYLTSHNLKLVEWFELAPGVMPETFVRIQIQHLNEHERKIVVTIS